MKNKTQLVIIHQKPTANLRHFLVLNPSLRFVRYRPRDQRPLIQQRLSPPLKRSTARTSQHAKNNKNTGTMIATIRRPPPAPILEVSAIAVRRAINHDDSDAAI